MGIKTVLGYYRGGKEHSVASLEFTSSGGGNNLTDEDGEFICYVQSPGDNELTRGRPLYFRLLDTALQELQMPETGSRHEYALWGNFARRRHADGSVIDMHVSVTRTP